MALRLKTCTTEALKAAETCQERQGGGETQAGRETQGGEETEAGGETQGGEEAWD